eukprot:TRINITY_DN61913_c0_g1_i2.p1 TRINITY_DN61913_c0_g1~~TRINITY_DN61913_c0_g1_i2.p1  ORF type:complete len:107 (+),score=36.24 TRINITY_DN61913_c0_g1_i2:142-462(+)
MLRSLVGSEMCIRDSNDTMMFPPRRQQQQQQQMFPPSQPGGPQSTATTTTTTTPSYTTELAMILDMGFEGVSKEQVATLLVKHNGDVDAVVIELAGAGDGEEGGDV